MHILPQEGFGLCSRKTQRIQRTKESLYIIFKLFSLFYLFIYLFYFVTDAVTVFMSVVFVNLSIRVSGLDSICQHLPNGRKDAWHKLGM